MGAEEIRYAAPAQSRNEAILAATVDGTQYTDPPQSRIEDLLLQLKAKIEQGGGGGTSDYDDLTNKPQINDVPLSGNKSGSDLGLQNALSFDSVPTDGSTNPVESNGVYDALAGKQDTLTTEQLRAVNSGMTAGDKRALTELYINLNYDPLNHNGIYRGFDLSGKYTIEQMYTRIHSGNFDDLFLGDYFTEQITTDIMTRFTGETFESSVTYYEMGGGTDVTARTWTETEDTTPQSGKTYATKETKTEFVTLMFAAFDYYYNTGDTALTTHHAVLIPRNYGFETTAKMNSTNTTVGAYYNSDMHQITLPCYAKSLKTMLGNHLLSHKTLLSTAINANTPSMAGAGFTGASSDWDWCATELQLMNEVQLYGSTIWSSSAYDVGIDCEKLPVFNFINGSQYSRNLCWLQSVASSAYFAYSSKGTAGSGFASYAGSVRPIILFG